MKTNCHLSIIKDAVLSCFVVLSIGLPNLTAQELEQLVSSKLEVIDEQDHQIVGCNSYLFDGQPLYEAPNVIRLYENGAYRFDVGFSYFGGKEIITQNNYLEKFYTVQIAPSSSANSRISPTGPREDHMAVYTETIGKPGQKDTLRFQLLDNTAKILAEMIYPFEIHANDPDATTTVFLPMEMKFQPLYLTLEDLDNPNNRIERQLLPFLPDTINVDAGQVFNLYTEIEQQVYLNNQSYVLVADYEKNYGYRADFAWQGKTLQYKPASENGLKSYLTVKPGRNRTPTSPVVDIKTIMAADLKKSGLDQAGKRVQQKYVFVEPKTNLKKVYTNTYLQSHTALSRSRKDQRGLEYLVQKNLSKIQAELNTTNQNVMHTYQMDAATKKQLQDQKKLYLRQQDLKMQGTPATKTNPDVKTSKIQKTTVVPRKKSEVRTANVPAATPQRMYIIPTTPQNSPYYTLAIEVSRETDPLAYQTYLITFRVIE